MDISNIVQFILQNVMPDVVRTIGTTGSCVSERAPGLIFVRTKKSAESLAAELSQRLGLEVPWVTSDVSEERRGAIAQGLRDGLLPMAVCTDAWSAGIDIPSLRWVALEAWTRAPIGLRQRAGRGARLSTDKTSFAVYVLPGGRYEREVREVLERSGAAVPEGPADPMQILEPRQPAPAAGGPRPRRGQIRAPRVPFTMRDALRVLFSYDVCTVFALILFALAMILGAFIVNNR